MHAARRSFRRLGILWVWCALQLTAPAYGAATPTFDREIARILQAHCTTCHGPDALAGTASLVTYAEVRALAASIKAQVASRAMPPWPADDAHSLPFRNDTRLSSQDLSQLLAWIDGGMPQGDPSDLPPLSRHTQGWQNPSGRAPDAIVSLPAFSVKASGEIPYIQVRVKVPLPNDRWISGLQVLPGNTVLVHHMGITEVQLANGVTPDNLQDVEKVARQLGIPPGALADAEPAVHDPDDASAYDMLATYTPGGSYESYGNGNAKLLRGGQNLYINFNIHYTTTGAPETDVSRLGLWFEDGPPKHQLVRTPSAGKTILANGTQLLTDAPGTRAEGTDVAIPPIPPNAPNYELIGVTAFAKPVTLFTFQPHAHFRGKDFRYVAVFPDGREQTLLTVPRFDFHWQLTYELANPLELPAGAKLVVIAHYDNSLSNRHLRETAASDPERKCGPEKQAFFRAQNQSWDEMFSPIVQYSVDHSAPAVDIVTVAGCMAQSASGAWTLDGAGASRIVRTQSTTATELRTAQTMPLGNEHYSLSGVEFFGPARYLGQKMVAKGALVRNASGTHLNVTSLQPLPGSCR